MRLAAFSLGLSLLSASGVSAQDVTVIGTHGKWTAYTYTENKQPVCYIAAKPDKSEGKYGSRDEVLMLVTHRPGEKAWDVISVVAGYQYKPDTDAVVTIGAQKFDLFTVGTDRAWARDAKIDRSIAQAMIKGNSAVVRGTSAATPRRPTPSPSADSAPRIRQSTIPVRSRGSCRILQSSSRRKPGPIHQRARLSAMKAGRWTPAFAGVT